MTSIKQQNKNRASGGYSSSDFKRNHGPGAPAEPSACLLHNPHAKESASTRLDHPSSILVLHAELASVRALLELASVRALRQRPLSLQPPIHSRICVRCAFPVADDYVTAKQTLQSPKSKVACTHTNKNQKMQMQILTNTYRRRAHANTHTHTQTPTQMLNFVSVRTIKGSSSTHAHDTFRFLS